MRAQAAAPKRPASPAHDSDDSSAAPSAKKRRVRRPALSTDEDMAILRAVLAVQPYRASWGQGRLKWQQTAAHVSAATGGEMSDELCKGRYVNLLKRFATPQEERKRPWPKDEELTKLLEEALAEQTKYEAEVEDEFDEKGNQRRKWQPLLAMRRPLGAWEKVEEGARDDPRAATAEKTVVVVPPRTRGPYKKRQKSPQEDSPALKGQDATNRQTRWTAPEPGARAPVIAATSPAPAAAEANVQASALASRAVASMTGGQATPSPTKLAPRPTPASTSAPTATPAKSVTTSAPSVSTTVSRPTAVALPSILRGQTPPARDSLHPGRQQQPPIPAPWLRPVAPQRESTTTTTNGDPSKPMTSTSTPPRETRPNAVTTSAPPRPTSSPQHRSLTLPSRGDRSSSVSSQPRLETGSNANRPVSTNAAANRDESSKPTATQPPAPRLTMVPQPGRLPLTHARHSPPVPGGSARDSTQSTPQRGAPTGPSTTPPPRDSNLLSVSSSRYSPRSGFRYVTVGGRERRMLPTQSVPRSGVTDRVSQSPVSDTRVNDSASVPRLQGTTPFGTSPVTERTSQSPVSESSANNSASFPRLQGASPIESMMLGVLDRLTDMERARLEDARQDRELKQRELEMRAGQHHGAGPNDYYNPDELEDMRRTMASLSASFATSREEQQGLQLEVARLRQTLQVTQREHEELQVNVSILSGQLKSAYRERDDVKSDLATLAKTVALLQSAMLQQDQAFETFKQEDAVERHREVHAQQEMLTRQLEQFHEEVEEDRRKRAEVVALIQKERDLNDARHRERIRQIDARASGTGKSRGAADSFSAIPASVESELAELRVAIDLERTEREREYTTLLQNIKQILAADQAS